MNIDAVLTPPEIDLLPGRDLSGVTCIVFDVLRATSSMITALAAGAREIHPVLTIEEALTLKKEMPDALLGGERLGEKIDGFDVGNSPLEYRDRVPARIITTTTNGTVALRACAHAARTLAGALLNIGALAEVAKTLDGNLLLVCAGTFREAALEDIFAAGLLCEALPDAHLSDAARTVRAVAAQYLGDPMGALLAAKNGQVLEAKGRTEEIRWCAQVSRFTEIGVLERGALRPYQPAGRPR